MADEVSFDPGSGPLPEGDIISFIDGDKRNFSLNNLASMSLGAERFHKIGTERLHYKYVMVKIDRLQWR